MKPRNRKAGEARWWEQVTWKQAAVFAALTYLAELIVMLIRYDYL